MKRCFFTIADRANMQYFEGLKNSLAKVTKDPLILIDEFKIQQLGDPQFFYRATPIIASGLLRDYDAVCKLDADQIILGNLDHIWEGDWDVGTVLNDFTYPIGVWDIKTYYNCGLVVLKNKDFVTHWLRLCMSDHFPRYQFREQDLLSILTSDYFNYRVKCLDDGDKIHGEWAKSLWPQTFMRDGKVIIPTPKGEKELLVVHFAGGQDPNKGNYRIRFQPDVVKHIETLIKT